MRRTSLVYASLLCAVLASCGTQTPAAAPEAAQAQASAISAQDMTQMPAGYVRNVTGTTTITPTQPEGHYTALLYNPRSIKQVQFLVNGVPINTLFYPAEETVSFSYAFGRQQSGIAVVTARVTDMNGRLSEAHLQVRVGLKSAYQIPQATISGPTVHSDPTRPWTFSFSGASDFGVCRAEFYLDGRLYDSINYLPANGSCPRTISSGGTWWFDAASNGLHTVGIKLYQDGGTRLIASAEQQLTINIR